MLSSHATIPKKYKSTSDTSGHGLHIHNAATTVLKGITIILKRCWTRTIFESPVSRTDPVSPHNCALLLVDSTTTMKIIASHDPILLHISFLHGATTPSIFLSSSVPPVILAQIKKNSSVNWIEIILYDIRICSGILQRILKLEPLERVSTNAVLLLLFLLTNVRKWRKKEKRTLASTSLRLSWYCRFRLVSTVNHLNDFAFSPLALRYLCVFYYSSWVY